MGLLQDLIPEFGMSGERSERPLGGPAKPLGLSHPGVFKDSRRFGRPRSPDSGA